LLGGDPSNKKSIVCLKNARSEEFIDFPSIFMKVVSIIYSHLARVPSLFEGLLYKTHWNMPQ
jgi:hypothetical protein